MTTILWIAVVVQLLILLVVISDKNERICKLEAELESLYPDLQVELSLRAEQAKYWAEKYEEIAHG